MSKELNFILNNLYSQYKKGVSLTELYNQVKTAYQCSSYSYDAHLTIFREFIIKFKKDEKFFEEFLKTSFNSSFS